MLGACTTIQAYRAGSAAVEGTRVEAQAAVAPLRADPRYASAPRYVGTLDHTPIEVRIGPKPAGDDEGVGGWQGEYRNLRTGAVRRLAGDRDGTTLTLEESDDGTRISGVWVGQFQHDGSVIGERTEPDGSRERAFDLRPEGKPVASY